MVLLFGEGNKRKTESNRQGTKVLESVSLGEREPLESSPFVCTWIICFHHNPVSVSSILLNFSLYCFGAYHFGIREVLSG